MLSAEAQYTDRQLADLEEARNEAEDTCASYGMGVVNHPAPEGIVRQIIEAEVAVNLSKAR